MNMEVIKCPNCNGQVQIDATQNFGFCSYCGTRLAFSHGTPTNATQTVANNREAALKEIQKVINHLQQISSHFKEIDKLHDDIYQLKRQQYNAYVVCGAFSLIMSYYFLINVAGSEYSSSIRVVFFLLFLGFLGMGLFLLVYRLSLRNKLKLSIVEKEKIIENLNQEIQNKYYEYPNCPIGYEYFRPEMLNTIQNYIRQGRAESIKEAINLISSDQYNAEMRQIALDTKNIAQQQLNMARQTRNVNTINMVNNILK